MPAGNASNHEVDGLTVYGDLYIAPSRTSTTRASIGSTSDGVISVGSTFIGNAGYLNGVAPSSTSVVRETIGAREAAWTGGTALTTQVMYSFAISLAAGDVIAALTFISAGTAAGTPTNWWFALYSNAATPALLAQTADQTTTAWAANTKMTLPLATAQTIATSGVYYAAVMVKATTPPNLYGLTSGNAVMNGALLTGGKVLAQSSGSALTTTAPATIASPTTIVDRAYCIASTATS